MAEPDRAPARFAILQLVRLAALGLVLIGAAIYAGRIGDSPTLGGLMLVAGAAGFFFLPRLLARRWRSPEE